MDKITSNRCSAIPIFSNRRSKFIYEFKNIAHWLLWLVVGIALFFYSVDEENGYAQQVIATMWIIITLYYGVRWITRKTPSSSYNANYLLKNGEQAAGEIIGYACLYPSNRISGYKYEFFDKLKNKHIGILGVNPKFLEIEIGSKIEIFYNESEPKIHAIILY